VAAMVQPATGRRGMIGNRNSIETGLLGCLSDLPDRLRGEKFAVGQNPVKGKNKDKLQTGISSGQDLAPFRCLVRAGCP